MKPSRDLFGKIIKRLEIEKQLKTAKKWLPVFSFGSVGSIVALALSLRMAWTAFSESGFFQFFSLLFSDLETITNYWQNFALSLLETIPATGLIALLAATLFFLESLNLLSGNIKKINDAKQLITA